MMRTGGSTSMSVAMSAALVRGCSGTITGSCSSISASKISASFRGSSVFDGAVDRRQRVRAAA